MADGIDIISDTTGQAILSTLLGSNSRVVHLSSADLNCLAGKTQTVDKITFDFSGCYQFNDTSGDTPSIESSVIEFQKMRSDDVDEVSSSYGTPAGEGLGIPGISNNTLVQFQGGQSQLLKITPAATITYIDLEVYDKRDSCYLLVMGGNSFYNYGCFNINRKDWLHQRVEIVENEPIYLITIGTENSNLIVLKGLNVWYRS